MEEEVQEIRSSIDSIRARSSVAASDQQRPDSLTLMRARLDALELELEEGDQPKSRALLSGVAARLDELEQESHGPPSPERGWP